MQTLLSLHIVIKCVCHKPLMHQKYLIALHKLLTALLICSLCECDYIGVLFLFSLAFIEIYQPGRQKKHTQLRECVGSLTCSDFTTQCS